MSWSRFFHRRRWDEERARELDAHLAIETDDNPARGMTPAEARDAARRKLGNPPWCARRSIDEHLDARRRRVWRDLKYGARRCA
jgi:hypothetical protein